MAKLLLGKEVTDALNANLQVRTATLREKGVVPTLGIIRIGEDPSDLSYEKGATKRAELVGVTVKKFELPGQHLCGAGQTQLRPGPGGFAAHSVHVRDHQRGVCPQRR